jgi:hypothetical protein
MMVSLRKGLQHMSGSTARLALPGLSLGFLLPHHLDTLGQKLQTVSSILGARGHLFQIMESLWVAKLLSQFLQDGLHFSED